MQAKVQKCGDGHMIQLSKETIESAGITMNEVLDVKVSDGIITLLNPSNTKH